jgi:hypothetical protein
LYGMKFPGCKACGDEGYHAARAAMCGELAKQFKTQAGELFANLQDNEALYLRAHIIAPILDAQKREIEYMNAFGSGFHDCTLTGLHP